MAESNGNKQIAFMKLRVISRKSHQKTELASDGALDVSSVIADRLLRRLYSYDVVRVEFENYRRRLGSLKFVATSSEPSAVKWL